MNSTSNAGTIDSVALGILWSRLIAVTDEQAVALMRSSFTPMVREIGDLSAAVFDQRGRMLAQANTGTPGHINSLATGMQHFLARYPVEELSPGDVLITNDPWFTSGQLNDISIVTPVFRGSSVVGFFGNTCHAIDIGGLGLSANGREVYEEGLQIPITKLYIGGEPNEQLLQIIEANVRSSGEVLGDLHAQVAGNQVGVDRLLEYLDEFGLDNLGDLADEVLDRSERAMRNALSKLPDGDYANESYIDGIGGNAIRIFVTVKVRGDSVVVDFDGSSEQSERGWNVVLNYTAAYTNYALKCALAPEVPHNHGSFRPVSVVAPEGSLFNPRFPAAVAARQIAGHFIPHAVFGALKDVLGDDVIAEGAAGLWVTTIRGIGQKRFVGVFFAAGGMGARATSDGLAATGFPSGVAAAPVEVLEDSYPLVFRRKELREGSGGAGRFRGGLGQTIEVEVRTGEPYIFSVLSDRIMHRPAGYNGGHDGALARIRTSTGFEGDPKLDVRMPANASFTLELPGGGGYHDPDERPEERILEDLLDGLIDEEQAPRDYGSRGTASVRRAEEIRRGTQP
jgi:N-methylhydantoinase B